MIKRAGKEKEEDKGKERKYHLRISNQSTFHNRHRLRPKPSRIPDHQIRQLAHLHASNDMTHALRNCRIDSILTHVSLDAEVICVSTLVFG